MRRITVRFPQVGEDERRKRKRGASAALLMVVALLGASWASAPPPAPPKPVVITQTVPAAVTTTAPATVASAPPALTPAQLVVTPLDLAFGPMPAPQMVRVSNGGDLPLPLGTPSTRGKSFRVSSDCPPELAKNESCGVAVVFDAAVAGSARDTLTIGSARIPLAGTAPPRPPVDLQPLDFGQRAVGARGEPQAIRLSNFSAASMSIGKVEVPRPFRVLKDACSGAQLPPSGVCDVHVGFEPASASTYEAELRVVGRRNELIARAALRGVAVAAPRIVQPANLPPVKLDIDPRQLDFGRIVSRKKTVTITNPGLRAVRISDVTLEPAGVFNVESQCRGVVLQPGQHCTVSVSVRLFHGAAAARIVVHYDGGSESAGISADTTP